MPPTKKSQKAAAARARAAKSLKKFIETVKISSDSAIEQSESDNDYDSDIECTGWT